MLPTTQLQAVIDRGRDAQEVLDLPAFQGVVNDLTSYHLAALVAAPPGDRGRDARDHHHLLQFALTELVAQLKGYAEAGEAAFKAVTDGVTEDEE